MSIQLTVNGLLVEIPDECPTLLAALRNIVGCTSPKIGCAPQGQCGCCTVLVNGVARVACVTPMRRVRNAEVVTLEGLTESTRQRWGQALHAVGGSQCGFCTSGIIMRLEACSAEDLNNADRVRDELSHHLCRCTGWNTIVDAAALRIRTVEPVDRSFADQRATLEGCTRQHLSVESALGGAGFAMDTAPPGTHVALRTATGEWVVAPTLAAARTAAARTPGRNPSIAPAPPLSLPEDEFDLSLATCWTDPSYVELDTAWATPDGLHSPTEQNGGAFGAKQSSTLLDTAQTLAQLHQKPIMACDTREDALAAGPKRPPMAFGVNRDGTGVIRVVRTDGVEPLVREIFPDAELTMVDIPGPPTSRAPRGAGWLELAAARSILDAADSPWLECARRGATARAKFEEGGTLLVVVDAGNPLDLVTLRSYCIGAAHFALSTVWSEGIVVAADGSVQSLTLRSAGVLSARDTPHIEVEITPSTDAPVQASEAVMGAVAAAAWREAGLLPHWPTRHRQR